MSKQKEIALKHHKIPIQIASDKHENPIRAARAYIAKRESVGDRRYSGSGLLLRALARLIIAYRDDNIKWVADRTPGGDAICKACPPRTKRNCKLHGGS